MSEKMWSRTDDWVGTEVDGSYVMVSVESGKYVALNQTAYAIWDLLETETDEGAITRHLLERFHVSAGDCESAVAGTLAQMREIGLVATPGAA